MKKNYFPNHKSIVVHLTDYCNQNCSFCFAREEMTKATKKQLNYNDFRLFVDKFKKLGILYLILSGGEPTLHPHFGKIINYGLKNFLAIKIYTNGVFSKKVARILFKHQKKITLVFNLNTPGFVFNKRLRRLITNNIKLLSDVNNVVLTFINLFINDSVIEHIKLVPADLIKKNWVKLNFQTPTVGEKNLISITDFPKVGKNIVKVVNYLKKIGPPQKILLKWFRPCMFTEKQKKRLDSLIDYEYLSNTHCPHIDYYFHITSDLNTFKCYPLSTIDNYKITTKTSLKLLIKKYSLLEKKRQKQYILDHCRKCSFFGFKKNQCLGPCLAFRINALKK